MGLFAAHPATSGPRGAGSTGRRLALALGLGRIAIGAGLALAPDAAMRALGFRRASGQTILVSRLAGGRDIVLGAAAVLARDDPERLARASLVNAVVDAGDAAAFAAALDGGAALRPAALRGLAAAVPATAAGIAVARSLSRST